MKYFIGIVIVLVVVAAYLALRRPEIVAAPELVAGKKVESPYVMADDRFIVVDGATIRLRDEGPRDAPAVILLHGFTFSLESFDAWAEVLKKDHRVIRYDLLGHGLTGPDPQQRYAPMERVAFLASVMDELEIAKADLGGNSLGGLIAWRFAAEHPARVGKLVLVSPGAFSINGVGVDPVPVPAPMAHYLRNAPEIGVRTALAYVYADDSKITEERVALARAMMAHPGNGDAFVQHIEEFTLPDPTSALASVTAPTLIMWGVQDAMIPSAHGSMMVDAMPNATLTAYALAGHAPQEELPEETARDAAAFLSPQK